MPEFKKICEPEGVPVYLQQLPDIVKFSHLQWMMYAGSADDEAVGEHGLYHWFEHVPFRGTEKFPGGYKDTAGRFKRYNGSVGAYTSQTATAFYSAVPTRLWQESLDVTTDLMSAPLLLPESIDAERQIIREEIATGLSTLDKRIWMEMPAIYWPGHPYGHQGLGTEKNLDAMDTSLLRTAHAKGYDRSRAVLFASGNLDPHAVEDAMTPLIQRLPHNGLSERRRPPSYGPLPAWQEGKTTEVETGLPSSAVVTSFYSDDASEKARLAKSMANAMVAKGGLSSPLYHSLREQKRFVYKTNTMNTTSVDGGIWGIVGLTQQKNVGAVRKAIEELLASDDIRSAERFAFVRDMITSEAEMEVINPSSYVMEAVGNHASYGHPHSREMMITKLLNVTHEEVLNVLDSYKMEEAHTIVLKGRA